MLDNNTALMMQAACATNNEGPLCNQAKAVPFMPYHCQSVQWLQIASKHLTHYIVCSDKGFGQQRKRENWNDKSRKAQRQVTVTSAAKGLNGKELPFLHSHPLLPALHYGHALATMYLVCIYRVPIQIAYTPDLHAMCTSYTDSSNYTVQRPTLSTYK